MRNTTRLLDVLDRVEAGPLVEESLWDMQVVPEAVAKVQAEFGIRFKPKEVLVPADDALADRLRGTHTDPFVSTLRRPSASGNAAPASATTSLSSIRCRSTLRFVSVLARAAISRSSTSRVRWFARSSIVSSTLVRFSSDIRSQRRRRRSA